MKPEEHIAGVPSSPLLPAWDFLCGMPSAVEGLGSPEVGLLSRGEGRGVMVPKGCWCCCWIS